MVYNRLLTYPLFFFISFLHSQNVIDVANLNVKLSFDQTQDYYYTFDKGDEIVFNFKMKKGRHLKNVEIASFSNLVFTEFNAKNITDKRIKVKRKQLYRFRFYSSSLTNRVANVRIQRIPSSNSTINFNTGWKWYTRRDTVYVPYTKDSVVGYRDIPYQETIRELVDTKTEEIMLFEKSEKVHSFWNKNLSRTYLRVDLPQIENSLFKEERILSWAYWIGVGQEGRKAYEKNVKSISKMIEKAASTYYQTPLAGLAVGAITELFVPNAGEDVAYYFIPDYENVKYFYNKQSFLQFDMGKGRAAYGRNDSRLYGTFYIGLSNDNPTLPIEVEVKVLALKEVKTYKDITYHKTRKVAQKITLNKTRMQVNETKYRVPVE